MSIILEFFSFNSYVLDFGLEGGVLGLGLGLGSCCLGLGLGLEVCVFGLALALGVMSLLTSLQDSQNCVEILQRVNKRTQNLRQIAYYAW